MRRLSLVLGLVLCSTVCGLAQSVYPSVSGSLGSLNASGGATLPGGPLLCALNVGGPFVGTVSFTSNGSPLTVNSTTAAITSTTAPVDTTFIGTNLGSVAATMTSYTSGSATWSLSCQEATAFNSGGVNTASANTFSALQSFNGSSASSQAGAPTTVYGAYYGLGNGTTNSTAIAIGWQTGTSGWACVSSCTTSNSAQICLYGMSTTGPLSVCPFVDITGVLNMSKVKITTSLNAGGNAVTGVAKLTQQAVNDIWGSCAMAAGTTCTVTWTYAPTFCAAQVAGATPIAGAVGISGTTVTVTAASSNSATWNVTCQ